MKKFLLLILLSTNMLIVIKDNGIACHSVSIVYSQRMFVEADSIYREPGWILAPDSWRCKYCGDFFLQLVDRNTHQNTCSYRPHIEYEYDNAGNRIESRVVEYSYGVRVAYNNSVTVLPPYDYDATIFHDFTSFDINN